MPTIASDGKGNYVALDDNGNWVPTTAPDTKQASGGNRFQDAPPEPPSPKPWTAQTGNYPNVDVPGASEGGLPAATSPPGSLEGSRAAIQQADIGAQDYLNRQRPDPPSDSGWSRLGYTAKEQALEAAAIGVHGLSTLAQVPINALIAASQGATGNLTIDPATNQVRASPEAVQTSSLVARPLQFSGAPNPLYVAPGTFDRKAPLSSEFRADPMTPGAKTTAATSEPAGPSSPTGVPITPPAGVGAPGGAATQPAPPSAPPVTTPADPPIMSQADIQARSRDLFKLPDQSAAGGAMLPDTNAAAVRKIFSDFIPSDTEAAGISAGDPALQAAKNVLPTGPMSYDTAMRIDRNLTARMRGASGTDAHELSQLQQGLRDQMDQVPDLENLRPARQAWMQSIKQGQMEDINEGAALKNDPAQKDAYVRQRAAALLKNDNAMRYWTPEEQAQLKQVATSGDIGMLGRLATALIKPATRVGLGAVGHSIAGPLGAIVGAEVGGDVGATAASRLRSYLSQTTLDPVMQQITRGVPPPYTPPNPLGPQP